MPGELNTGFLVSAAMLQDFLVDKCGRPLSRGRITLWVDTDRSVLKNWYYQTGIPSATGNGYEFLPLPNPLTLSAAGTICTPSGQDVIPFYYIVSNTDNVTPQLYYIVVTDCNGQLMFTRSGFPFSQNNVGPIIENEGNISNYVINNRFWRNIETLDATTLNDSWTTQYNNSGTVYHAALAPSQHDGFSMHDFQFIKNVNGAHDSITFSSFPDVSGETFTRDIAGEYYLNHICSQLQAGETLKCYQFPISLHNNTLVGVPFTFTIEAQSISGANTISATIYQFAGTGNASADPIPIGTTGQITLNSEWGKYTLEGTFPDTTGLPTVTTFDDALYLQINMPLSALFQLNFCVPSIYLTQAEIPTNDFATYDQIDAVVNSPRLGDIRTSLNAFTPFGWNPMNDGTIGNASSNATTRKNADQWPLFNLIWTLCAPYSAPAGGTSNPLAQMYNSAGSAVGYGPNITAPTTALADFNNGNQLSLAKSMGKVFLGTVPLSSLLAASPTITGFSSVVTASSSTGLLLTTAASNLLNLFTGNTVTFQNTGGGLPGNIVATSVYYIIPISSTTFKIATSFANALAGTAVAYSSAGTGTTTAYIQTTASVEGEYGHTQLVTELASHIHTIPYSFAVANALAVGGAFAASNGTTNTSTPVGGATNPFNVTQPGTFMNIYIKY